MVPYGLVPAPGGGPTCFPSFPRPLCCPVSLATALKTWRTLPPYRNSPPYCLRLVGLVYPSTAAEDVYGNEPIGSSITSNLSNSATHIALPWKVLQRRLPPCFTSSPGRSVALLSPIPTSTPSASFVRSFHRPDNARHLYCSYPHYLTSIGIPIDSIGTRAVPYTCRYGIPTTRMYWPSNPITWPVPALGGLIAYANAKS